MNRYCTKNFVGISGSWHGHYPWRYIGRIQDMNGAKMHPPHFPRKYPDLLMVAAISARERMRTKSASRASRDRAKPKEL